MKARSRIALLWRLIVCVFIVIFCYQMPREKINPLPPKPRVWITAIALFLLTLLVYIPSMSNGFIWDDPQYVVDNPTLKSAGGLWSIWTDPLATPQYYPMVHTTFWIECATLGHRPGNGFSYRQYSSARIGGCPALARSGCVKNSRRVDRRIDIRCASGDGGISHLDHRAEKCAFDRFLSALVPRVPPRGRDRRRSFKAPLVLGSIAVIHICVAQ